MEVTHSGSSVWQDKRKRERVLIRQIWVTLKHIFTINNSLCTWFLNKNLENYYILLFFRELVTFHPRGPFCLIQELYSNSVLVACSKPPVKSGLSKRCNLESTAMQSFNRVFHSLYKVGKNISIGIKGFNSSKKVTSSEARPDARDYYWFRSPVPNRVKLAFAVWRFLNFCSCITWFLDLNDLVRMNRAWSKSLILKSKYQLSSVGKPVIISCIRSSSTFLLLLNSLMRIMPFLPALY